MMVQSHCRSAHLRAGAAAGGRAWGDKGVVSRPTVRMALIFGQKEGQMRYLLTGATGFIGGRVARQLREAGHEVVAVVRDPARAGSLAAQGVLLAQGDVTDKESMRGAMTGVDGVFHIAGWYKIGTRDKRDGTRINIDGTRNVLELMRELRIPKGVYTSTVAVFSDTHGRMPDESYRYNGPHITEYDRTKWVAHYEVAEPLVKAGLPLVTVLPGLVYGPGDTSSVRTNFIQYLRRKLPLLPKTTAFCWAHVDDIAGAHIWAMARGKAGESYIIVGPRHTFIEAMRWPNRSPAFRPRGCGRAPACCGRWPRSWAWSVRWFLCPNRTRLKACG